MKKEKINEWIVSQEKFAQTEPLAAIGQKIDPGTGRAFPAQHRAGDPSSQSYHKVPGFAEENRYEGYSISIKERRSQLIRFYYSASRT